MIYSVGFLAHAVSSIFRQPEKITIIASLANARRMQSPYYGKFALRE